MKYRFLKEINTQFLGKKINNYKNKWIRNIRRIDELSLRRETYKIPTLEKLPGF
jgi:hypothetical protein